MSRLDSAIRRLQAQKVVLEAAALEIQSLPGIVLELGLGNGRTYDHLREILKDREIYVFEREVAAHPDCIPPQDRLFLGDLFDTLPRAIEGLEGQAAFVHMDIGTGEKQASIELAQRALPLILRLMKPSSVLVSDQPVGKIAELEELPLPDGVKPGRIHFYRLANKTG